MLGRRDGGSVRVERLTYVHDGDPGVIGQLVSEARGLVRFGGEGSGLLELDRANEQPASPGDVSVRIMGVKFSSLSDDVRAEIGEENVPCILAHSGVTTTVLLPARSLARVTGGLSDLRGKIRFGLARIGWEL
jgi:hypothetical protein